MTGQEVVDTAKNDAALQFFKKDCKSNVDIERATAKIEHVDLNWKIDFEKSEIYGLAEYTIRKLGDNVAADRSLEMDIRDLSIRAIRGLGERSENDLQFQISPNKDSEMGSLLKIEHNGSEKIRIEYKTAPGAHALQWLPKQSTQTKTHPFLYSQCQATHCRSILPCVDSPMAKFTYTAKVEAPKGIRVLMSAQNVSHDMEKGVFEFRQSKPVSSYLVAIAAGNLEGRKIGPRSTVWSEPGEILDMAEKDFKEVEKMIRLAEDLLGPYEWEVYDILVMPYTFPYGGMENPCLTFATPSIITGDKSLVSVIVHEIVHSWMGNTVTNSNWEHFWLNEGHTRYLEMKLVSMLMDNSYDGNFGSMFVYNGFRALVECVHTMEKDGTPELTRLVTDLSNIDTDNAFSMSCRLGRIAAVTNQLSIISALNPHEIRYLCRVFSYERHKITLLF
ncbi:hypothetical protein ACOME3_008219 [Neoechinorhynchus agilis]